MEAKKYKLRCRKKGILVTTNPHVYDVVWVREYSPEVYAKDNK